MIKGRILLIDDEPMIREMLLELLIEEGINAVAHQDAFSAFPLLSQNFDLVICDVTLPKLSGIDFLKKIKVEGLHKGKTLLMTGNALSADMEQVADRVLYKPFQTSEIIRVVREMLS